MAAWTSEIRAAFSTVSNTASTDAERPSSNHTHSPICNHKYFICNDPSRSPRRLAEDNNEKRRVFCEPATYFRFNLSEGFGTRTYTESQSQGKFINVPLLSLNKEGLLKAPGAEFVCYRGLLTKIAATPYVKEKEMKIVAQKFWNTIYLCSTGDRTWRPTPLNENSYRGHKFETYVTRAR